MKKTLLLSLVSLFAFNVSNSQTEKAWIEKHTSDVSSINKIAQRPEFPDEFKLYQLDLASLKTKLFQAEDRFKKNAKSVIITIPNSEGELENYKVFEASNFDAELQSQFPEIKAFVGNGIENPKNVLRLSISPNGIQTMTIKPNGMSEFMEPYSSDNNIYAAYTANNRKGKLPFTCGTMESNMADKIFEKKGNANKSSLNQILTFRLALSCNAEYSNYFGASNSGQVANVLAAFNNTMTRVNGVFEKDFCIHMNIISQSTNVIYYTAGTDPYTTMANWNTQLQNTLSNNLTGVGTPIATNNAAYDVGHFFGSTGGGGNAGCIGCVCVDDTDDTTDTNKGSGYTSPGNGVPAGDTFDIDYVAHEMGHQFGANHTFSNSVEGSGVNVEPGSGSTIMGYAGITSYDVQPNSNAYFHIVSIDQVQSNMETKSCPVRTSISNNTPVVNAGLNYTIPKSTPFILTAVGSDADAGNALTYCWEQIDSATTQTNAQSAATATKTGGPTFRSYSPTSVNFRYFPRIQSVIANSTTTAGTEINVEALSSVARNLNFAVTVRDNVAGFGQTQYDVATLAVNGTAGPFAVTAPNTAVSWQSGTNQNVTWNVSGTTANNVNCPTVDIYLSTDGGNTYPILLATNVPNDGTETILVPNNAGTTNRIMVKGYNHVFFDISNANFTITAPASTFGLAYGGGYGLQNKTICQGNSTTYTLNYTALGGFSGTTNITATGNPANTTVTFTPNSINSNGTVTVNVTTTGAVALGSYTIVVTGTSGATTKTTNLYLTIVSGSFTVQTLSTPANSASGVSTSPVLTWPANAVATAYDVQVATDAGFTNIISSTTVTGTSVSVSGLNEISTYYWRVLPKNTGCSGTFSTAYSFNTGESNCTYNYSNTSSLNIADGTGANAPGPTATETIIVPGSVLGNINSVTTTVDLTHTYVQDLVLELSHPDGTKIRLMNRNCDEGATTPSSYSFNFTDSAANVLPNGSCLNPVISGDVKPQQPLGAFGGKTAAGTWTLSATDYYNGDVGNIDSWSITFCMAQLPLANASFNNIDDLTIYPNPNNGNFNVNFTSQSSNDIEIIVHDIRGRQVFNKSFRNNSVFNQSIQLNNAESGIYIVTVKDGERKENKKIVIQ
ncbi:MAG: zinc-dependent metalloprotease family protein [Bacteroidota bacterium]